MKLSNFSWIEICSIFADLGGCHLSLVCNPIGDKIAWSAEFVWHNDGSRKDLPIADVASGLSCTDESSDEACKKLLQDNFKWSETFPGKFDWKIPNVEFSTKEELEMKLAVAGIDLEFMLTHCSA